MKAVPSRRVHLVLSTVPVTAFQTVNRVLLGCDCCILSTVFSYSIPYSNQGCIRLTGTSALYPADWYVRAVPGWLVLQHCARLTGTSALYPADWYVRAVPGWLVLQHCARLTGTSALYPANWYVRAVPSWLVLQHCARLTGTSALCPADWYVRAVPGWLVLQHCARLTGTSGLCPADWYIRAVPGWLVRQRCTRLTGTRTLIYGAIFVTLSDSIISAFYDTVMWAAAPAIVPLLREICHMIFLHPPTINATSMCTPPPHHLQSAVGSPQPCSFTGGTVWFYWDIWICTYSAGLFFSAPWWWFFHRDIYYLRSVVTD